MCVKASYMASASLSIAAMTAPRPRDPWITRWMAELSSAIVTQCKDQSKCLTISRLKKVKNETCLTPSLQCPCSRCCCCCTRRRPARSLSELQNNLEHSKEKSLAGCLAGQGGHRRKMKIVPHLSGLLLPSGTPWPARHVYPARLVAAPCWSSRSSRKYKCCRSFLCKKTKHRYNLEAFNPLPSRKRTRLGLSHTRDGK